MEREEPTRPSASHTARGRASGPYRARRGPSAAPADTGLLRGAQSTAGNRAIARSFVDTRDAAAPLWLERTRADANRQTTLARDQGPAPDQEPQAEPGTGGLSLINLVLKLDAQARHRANQERFNALIDDGLDYDYDPDKGADDPDLRFRNACQWIRRDDTRVRVLSPTHDAEDRKDEQRAYFDATVAYPDVGGDYPLDTAVTNDPRLRFARPGVAGSNGENGKRIDMFDLTGRSDDAVKATLAHEVQHSADRSWPGQRWAVDDREHNDYQSEFRAYWTDYGEHHPNDTFGSSAEEALNDRTVEADDPDSDDTLESATNFRNRRQENIFWHLVDGGYRYVARGYVEDPDFKAMVDAFDRPVGGNLINSVRIESLAARIDACEPGMSRDAPEVAKVLAAADDLDAADRAYLGDAELSAPFWETARQHLPPVLLLQLSIRVGLESQAPGEPTLPPLDADSAYA